MIHDLWPTDWSHPAEAEVRQCRAWLCLPMFKFRAMTSTCPSILGSQSPPARPGHGRHAFAHVCPMLVDILVYQGSYLPQGHRSWPDWSATRDSCSVPILMWPYIAQSELPQTPHLRDRTSCKGGQELNVEDSHQSWLSDFWLVFLIEVKDNKQQFHVPCVVKDCLVTNRNLAADIKACCWKCSWSSDRQIAVAELMEIIVRHGLVSGNSRVQSSRPQPTMMEIFNMTHYFLCYYRSCE